MFTVPIASVRKHIRGWGPSAGMEGRGGSGAWEEVSPWGHVVYNYTLDSSAMHIISRCNGFMVTSMQTKYNKFCYYLGAIRC